MAYIGKQPVVGNFVKLDAITTSATASYNLLSGGVAYFPQTANNCIVSLNGVIQSPTSAYTISGSTIVFSDALTSSDTIDFILVLGDVLSIGTPSDSTVTTAKLATDLTVTHALGSAGSPSITFNGDTNTGIFSPTADTIAFAEGGTEGMRIDSSGNVLIGTTTSPSGSKELVLGGDYIEGVVAIGTVGATHTIALTNGTVQTATLTSATACTFTMPTATAGKSFILLLKQPASGTPTTATFTGVKYGTTGAPTITATLGKMDILTFVADGTNWYGSYIQGYTP
jgi:hypothetical protein